LRNDTTGLPIGDEQYNLWRSTFGNAANGVGASLAAVPEPSGCIYISFLALTAIFYRGQREGRIRNGRLATPPVERTSAAQHREETFRLPMPQNQVPCG